METIKKVLAVFFSIVFVVTAIFALIFFNFEHRAFKTDIYQQVFAREDFYNRIPAMLASAMISSPANFQDLPLAMQGMSTQAWEGFFRTLLPQDTLKLIGDDVLLSTSDYLNMQSDSVTISLLPIKANMGTESGVQAVFTLLQTQPACTLEQIAQTAFNLLNGQEVAFCNPPEQLAPLLAPAIQAQMQAAALIIPSEVTLISVESGKQDPRERIQNARTLMKLSPLVPLGFLLLLTLTIVNSLQSWLLWWGTPFASTGIIASLVAVTGAPVMGAILKRVIMQRAGNILPSSFSDYASDLASAMIGAIMRPIFWEGLFLFFVGSGMVLISIYLGRKTKNKRR